MPPKYKTALKHKRFVKSLIKNDFQQAKAYQEVYPKANYNTARTESTKLMDKEHVQLELVKQCEGITPEWIADQLSRLAQQSKRDADKIRALELLGRWKKNAMFESDSSSNQLNIVTAQELDAIKAKLLEQKDQKETKALTIEDVNPLAVNELEQDNI